MCHALKVFHCLRLVLELNNKFSDNGWKITIVISRIVRSRRNMASTFSLVSRTPIKWRIINVLGTDGDNGPWKSMSINNERTLALKVSEQLGTATAVAVKMVFVITYYRRAYFAMHYVHGDWLCWKKIEKTITKKKKNALCKRKFDNLSSNKRNLLYIEVKNKTTYKNITYECAIQHYLLTDWKSNIMVSLNSLFLTYFWNLWNLIFFKQIYLVNLSFKVTWDIFHCSFNNCI